MAPQRAPSILGTPKGGSRCDKIQKKHILEAREALNFTREDRFSVDPNDQKAKGGIQWW